MKSYNTTNFKARVSKAKKIYCSNNLQFGLKLLPVDKALECSHIQLNNSNVISFLVIDIDHNNPFIFDEVGLPAPNFLVIKKKTGTSHLIYALKTPIPKDYNTSKKALEYFALIQQEYTKILEGDPMYANMIAKNPMHEEWQVWNINHFYPYELGELADHINLPPKKQIKKREAIAEGRNCYLFDTVRKWAYKEVLFYKSNGATYENFYNVVFNRLDKLNIFPASAPLEFKEIKNIAKSISKWVWKNFTQEKYDEIFSKVQKARSHKRKTVKQANLAKMEYLNEFS